MAPTCRRSKRKPAKNNTSDTSIVPRKRAKKNPTNQNTKAKLIGKNKRRSTKMNVKTNLPQTDSVVFISEIPCNSSRMEREKYKRLQLNSALFLSPPLPAKRVQSHISVITISTDDSEVAVERTAEWVENLETGVDSSELSCREEAFVGDVDPLGGEQLSEQMSEAEDVREQMSLLQIPPKSSATQMRLSSANSESQGSRSATNTDYTSNKSLPFSFLTNPPIGLYTDLNLSLNSEHPHTISTDGSSKVTENATKNPNNFLFGNQKSFLETWKYNTPHTGGFVLDLFSPPVENEDSSESQQNPSSCLTSTEPDFQPNDNPEEELENQTLLEAPSTSSPETIPIHQHSSDGSSEDETFDS
uniref:Uncharacterized protein n=1 Tax=Graphocephala atropunctata TaxID=36148 RepID=A0A1B6MUA6_9HEMI